MTAIPESQSRLFEKGDSVARTDRPLDEQEPYTVVYVDYDKNTAVLQATGPAAGSEKIGVSFDSLRHLLCPHEIVEVSEDKLEWVPRKFVGWTEDWFPIVLNVKGDDPYKWEYVRPLRVPEHDVEIEFQNSFNGGRPPSLVSILVSREEFREAENQILSDLQEMGMGNEVSPKEFHESFHRWRRELVNRIDVWVKTYFQLRNN